MHRACCTGRCITPQQPAECCDIDTLNSAHDIMQHAPAKVFCYIHKMLASLMAPLGITTTS